MTWTTRSTATAPSGPTDSWTTRAAVPNWWACSASSVEPSAPGAVPRRARLDRLRVAVDLGEPARSAVAQALDASRHLVSATRPAGAIATVTGTADSLALLDAAGQPWRNRRFATNPADLDALVEILDGIAVGQRLVDLPSGTGRAALGPVVSFTLGTESGGTARPLAPHGERLAAGTPITLSLRNTSDGEVFAWLFDVGVSGRSSLVTNAGRSGTRLGPRGSARRLDRHLAPGRAAVLAARRAGRRAG